MKMPTIVGIFIFISRENFMLSLVEHEKGFITSEPECRVLKTLFGMVSEGHVIYVINMQ